MPAPIRELYQGRLKAQRDAQTWETALKEALEKAAELEQHRAELEQRLEESERRRVETEQQLGEGALKYALVGQIQLCERLLGREVTESRELEQRDEQALRALAQNLERELGELR